MPLLDGDYRQPIGRPRAAGWGQDAAQDGKNKPMTRPRPLDRYTDEQIAHGITSGMALAPRAVLQVNLARLRREGITLALHFSPRYVRYTSDSGATYSVSDVACDCPAGLRGGVCRHMQTVRRLGGVAAIREALA